MNRPFTLIALVLALLLALSPLTAAAAPTQQAANPLVVPITGIVTDVGTFAGTFTVQSFTFVNGQLAAVGTLTGNITNAAGQIVGNVTQQVTIPVTSVSGTCDVLHLTLGPVDLSLLGMNVHLNQVVLDISASAAPGNLLGNLLCTAAHLLDTGGPLSGLVDLLNGIVGILAI